MGNSDASIADHVLVVEDDESQIKLLRRLLENGGFVVDLATTGEAALAMVAACPPTLILSDVRMPGTSGVTICRLLKNDPATRLIPLVLITGLDDGIAKLAGLAAGADDFLVKPVNGTELLARVQSLVRAKRFTDDLDSAEATLVSLAKVIEARDDTTAGHCQRVLMQAVLIGNELGLPSDDLIALQRGAILHDIGKVGVADRILLKPGALDARERRTMQQHTVIGDEICQRMRLLRLACPIIRHHHERQDGSGYPDGLSGDAVPLIAQIVGVVDVFDALTMDRPYRKALHQAEAFDVLEDEVRRGWHRADLVHLLGVVVQADVTVPRMTA